MANNAYLTNSTFYRGPEFKAATPRKEKRKDFVNLASASFEEISKLHSTISDQKYQIANLTKELKSLKLISGKQERALAQVEKDHGDYPHLMKVMAEELRVLKVI